MTESIIAQKFCPKCEKEKSIIEFSCDKTEKDGKQTYCKLCRNDYNVNYKKTKKGLIANLYADQLKRSRLHGYGLPAYSLDDLRDWAFSQEIFHNLYNGWVESGYKKMQRPSIDRLDDYNGYSLEGIQLMTWQDNFDKGHADMFNGINNKQSKAVIQFTREGLLIEEYYSVSKASRETGITLSRISECCNNKRKDAGGYAWCFASNTQMERA